MISLLLLLSHLEAPPTSVIRVGDVISGKDIACEEEDDVQDALTSMRSEKFRRLPVVAPEGRRSGIIPLADLAIAATSNGNRTKLCHEDIMLTLQAIWAHRSGER